jgi:nitrate/nitrite-specific signal transduction histidine kinase
MDKSDPSVESYKRLLNDINQYLLNFSRNEQYRTAVISSLLWVFGAGILLIIIQIVFMTIFFSHKLAGPVYRFEMVCHNIIKGVYTDIINLRKGDEMKNLATLLNEVIERTRIRFQDLKKSNTDEERNKIFDSLKL